MKLFFRIIAVSFLFSLSACSTLQVTTEYDHDANFENFRYYAWLAEPVLPENNQLIDNKILDEQIRISISKNMGNKGLQYQDSAKPNFLIGYHVAIDQKSSINSVNSNVGYEPAWSANAWRGTTDLGQQYFEQGSIIIDIVNASTNELIWRANASAEIDPYINTNTRLQRIDKAISKMLREFPPRK